MLNLVAPTLSSITSYPKDKIKILLLEGIHPDGIAMLNQAGYYNIEALPKALSEDELIARISDVHLLGIRSKTQVTARVLQHASRLWAIGCFCIGTNQVDMAQCTEQGITVFNSPYSNTRSVAELVIGEAIMLLRRIPERDKAVHQGQWPKTAKGSFEVRGKVMGIVGYGHIGSQVSVLAESLGFKVFYYDIAPKLPLGNATAINTLSELLSIADVLSLHVPATPETRNMLNAETIAQMKPGAILLNLSRGSVVDIPALQQAIQNNHLSGAGIDVFPHEPESNNDLFNSPLQGLPNVILTPHIGGSTLEAQQNISKDVAYKFANFLDKGTTLGSLTVPELNLSDNPNAHRLLHVHRNVPGVLSALNNLVSGLNLNIVGQHLKTNEKIGYVVLDVSKGLSKETLTKFRDLPNTLKARVLY